MAPWVLHYLVVETSHWWLALFLLLSVIEDLATHWCRTCHSCTHFGSADSPMCRSEIAHPECSGVWVLGGFGYVFTHESPTLPHVDNESPENPHKVDRFDKATRSRYQEALAPPVFVATAGALCLSPVLLGGAFLLLAGVGPLSQMKRGAYISGVPRHHFLV